MHNVRLRQATEADADFLYRVLKTTMLAYVDQTWGWDEAEQKSRFERTFDPSQDRIIVFEGAEIGVLSTELNEDEIFIAKIYILPDYQNRGIGTQLIRGVLAEASRRGVPVTLRVLKVNPARRLYERLGFVQVGETEPSYLMKAMTDRESRGGCCDR